MTTLDRRGGLLKYGFVGPALALLIALNIFPLLYNIGASFTSAGSIGGGVSFLGVRNYARIFTDPEYVAAMRVTAVFVAVAVSVELLLGFVLALALRESFRGRGTILTILLIPMMLSPAVMGLFWHQILKEDYGVLNQMLAVLGLGEPQWTVDPGLKLVSVLIIDIWMWTPFMMLIALAGLNSIPQYIYEAAEIDRAGPWRVFWKITLPMSAPLLALAVLLRTTDALKQFDLVMAIAGRNEAATKTLSVLLYEQLICNQKIGLGSAYACVVLVVVIAIASIFTRYIDYIQHKQGRLEG